jgi:methylation protein EvaC
LLDTPPSSTLKRAGEPVAAVPLAMGAGKIDRMGYLVGEHRHHTRCRFCLNETLLPFMDFGYVPLAGGFHKPGSVETDFARERVFPLQLCFCQTCTLVQVNDVVAGEVLFRDYFYFSSAIWTLAEHFQRYAQQLQTMFPEPGEATLLEIGCNDGVFLRPLRAFGFNVIGIDPATNVVASLINDGFDIVNDFFSEELAVEVRRTRGPVDAIFSSNAFAHIDDMQNVMRGVKTLLKPEGFLVFEVHYLGAVLREMQYDMIYHEHLGYYSLTSVSNFMDRFGMEVFDVQKTSIHGGSVRFSVQSRTGGTRPISKAVEEMRREEQAWRFADAETYKDFANRVARTRSDLVRLLDSLKAEGKSIVGYGASGRATTMSAYCGLSDTYLNAVVDDAPAKQGAFTPGNHLQIVDSSILRGPHRPDYALLFAWTFADEIAKRNPDYLSSGGKFIVPLPEVRIIGS